MNILHIKSLWNQKCYYCIDTSKINDFVTAGNTILSDELIIIYNITAKLLQQSIHIFFLQNTTKDERVSFTGHNACQVWSGK